MGCIRLDILDEQYKTCELKKYTDKNVLTLKNTAGKERSGYLFGFNGKEKLNEQYGEGNAYDFGARIYDPRIGRFFSIDPSAGKFPELSPYLFAINNPIKFIDIYGFGPGDGVMRVYTTIITIVDRNGVSKDVYVAKRYYQNVTNSQAKNYSDKALTPNGWYIISKEEYDIQHGSSVTTSKGNERVVRKANPNAFTQSVNGADDLERTTKEYFTDEFYAFDDDTDPPRMSDGRAGIAHKITTDRGTFKFTGDDPTSSYEFSIYAVDADGKSRVLGSVKIAGTSPVYLDFTLNPGEYVDFDRADDDLTGPVITIELVTTKAAKSTDRATDTIDKYGSESPEASDIKIIQDQINK